MIKKIIELLFPKKWNPPKIGDVLKEKREDVCRKDNQANTRRMYKRT